MARPRIFRGQKEELAAAWHQLNRALDQFIDDGLAAALIENSI